MEFAKIVETNDSSPRYPELTFFRIVDEITAMAAAHVGATVIIPALPSASEDKFFSAISTHQHIINKELIQNSLSRLFATRRTGHDGAVIIDVFGYAEPQIRSSRHHLPYDATKFNHPVENRGLRHNTAAYASSLTDSLIIVVSEEHGTVSVFRSGSRFLSLTPMELTEKIHSFVSEFAMTGVETLDEAN